MLRFAAFACGGGLLQKVPDEQQRQARRVFRIDASFGAAGGVGLPLIGGILRHRQASTTQRYAPVADTPLRTAANVIAGEVAASLFRGGWVSLSRSRAAYVA